MEQNKNFNVREIKRPDGSLLINKELPFLILEYKTPRKIPFFKWKPGAGKTMGIAARSVEEVNNKNFVVIVCEGITAVDKIYEDIKLLLEHDTVNGHNIRIEKFYKQENQERDEKLLDIETMNNVDILITHHHYLGLLHNNPLGAKKYPLFDFLETYDRYTVVFIDEIHEIFSKIGWEIPLSFTTPRASSNEPWNTRIHYDGIKEFTYCNPQDNLKLMYPIFINVHGNNFFRLFDNMNNYNNAVANGDVKDISSWFILGDYEREGTNTKQWDKYPVGGINLPAKGTLSAIGSAMSPEEAAYQLDELIKNSGNVYLLESVEGDSPRRSYFPGMTRLKGMFVESLKTLFKKNLVMLFSADSTIDEILMTSLIGQCGKQYTPYEQPELSTTFTCSDLDVTFVYHNEKMHDYNELAKTFGHTKEKWRWVCKTKKGYEFLIKHDALKGKRFIKDKESITFGDGVGNMRDGGTINLMDANQITYTGSPENTGTNYERYDWTFVNGLNFQGILSMGTLERRDAKLVEVIKQVIGRIMREVGNKKHCVFFIDGAAQAKMIQDNMPLITSVKGQLTYSFIENYNGIVLDLLEDTVPPAKIGSCYPTKAINKKYQTFKDGILKDDTNYSVPKKIIKAFANDIPARKQVCEFWIKTYDKINTKLYQKNLSKIETIIDSLTRDGGIL